MTISRTTSPGNTVLISRPKPFDWETSLKSRNTPSSHQLNLFLAISKPLDHSPRHWSLLNDSSTLGHAYFAAYHAVRIIDDTTGKVSYIRGNTAIPKDSPGFLENLQEMRHICDMVSDDSDTKQLSTEDQLRLAVEESAAFCEPRESQIYVASILRDLAACGRIKERAFLAVRDLVDGELLWEAWDLRNPDRVSGAFAGDGWPIRMMDEGEMPSD